MPPLEQRPYPEIVRDLEAFKTYLAEVVRLPVPRRLRKIIANINELEQIRLDNRLQDLISPANNRAREMVWSIVEGQQLTTIFAGLQGSDRSVLKRLLRKALKGPLDPTDEDSDKSTNKPRNILFELLLGAQFHRANFDVKLGGEADLQFDHAGARLYIECKRPFVEKTIPQNVAKARQQLQQRFKEDVRDSGMGGLVAISVSKVLNVGHNMFTVDDEDGLKQLGGDLMKIHERYCRDYDKLIDIRLVGMFYHLFTPAYVRRTGRLISASEILIRVRGDSFQSLFPVSGELLEQRLRSLGGM